MIFNAVSHFESNPAVVADKLLMPLFVMMEEISSCSENKDYACSDSSDIYEPYEPNLNGLSNRESVHQTTYLATG